jgi:ribosomal protein S18 acetylase RimI-like enzyme
MAEQNRVVRRAAIDDVGALVPLFDAYRQFYAQSPSPDQAREFLLERFRRAESTLFIAMDAADSAIGFAQLFPSFSSVSLARSFILNDLFVAPRHRCSGVGKALLGAAVAFCEASGAVRVSLSTEVTNSAAQALYEANGWTRQLDYYTYALKL